MDHPSPRLAETSDPLLALLPADWRMGRDVPCPVCRYNLRGLREARCPECGRLFHWQELLHVCCARCGAELGTRTGGACAVCALETRWEALLDGATVIRRSLFEYSNRPLLALVATMFRVLLPRGFWRGYVLEMPPNLARLRRYRCVMQFITCFGILLAPLFFIGIELFFYGDTSLFWKEKWLLLIGTVLGVPMLIGGLLPWFSPTLNRFAIRQDQLARCKAYLWTGGAWLGIAAIGIAAGLGGFIIAQLPAVGRWSLDWYLIGQYFEPLSALPTLVPRTWWKRPPVFGYLLDAAFVGLLVWWAAFLFASLRRYLRLSIGNAFALTISSYTIALLIVSTVYALFGLGYLTVARV